MPSPLLLLRRVCAVACAVTWAATAWAQTPAAAADPCAAPLAEAQQQYVDGAYAEVEPLVLACVDLPEATPAQREAGYRLLALSFVRQDLLHDAQMTVLKLLGVNHAYAPDLVQDPPFFVALVTSIKQQLRVASSRTTPAAALPAPAPGERVDVNAATAAELEAVPGIGPVMAARIVEHRRQQGAFQRLSDLDAVSGIGERTLARLMPYLTVGPAMQTFRAAGGVPVAELAQVAVREPPAPAAPAGALVNVNTASAAELETLSGIGPALAQRIIAHREAVGPFQSIDDLVEVRGIGPRTLERFAAFVTVGDAP